MAYLDRFPAPRLPGPLSSPLRYQIVAGFLAVAITLADYATGPYLAFATFYLIPVIIMAWYATLARAMAFAVIVAVGGVAVRALDPGVVTSAVITANGVLRLVIFVFTVWLVDAERRARLQVVKLSTTDPLTGMLNRRAFEDLGADRLQLAARRQTPVTLIYTDLDDLKVRNDRFGHDAGDRMIIAFGRAMAETFRSSDLVTRIGGDEFCCLLSDTDEERAEAALCRFEGVLEQIEAEPIHASMGAVSTVPDPCTTSADLVHEADALMYEAKLAGKGEHRTRTIDASNAGIRTHPSLD